MSLVEMTGSSQLRGSAAQRAMGIAVLQDRAKGLPWKTISHKYGKSKNRLLELAILAGLKTRRELTAAEQRGIGIAVLRDRAAGLSWKAITRKYRKSEDRLMELSKAAKDSE